MVGGNKTMRPLKKIDILESEYIATMTNCFGKPLIDGFIYIGVLVGAIQGLKKQFTNYSQDNWTWEEIESEIDEWLGGIKK